MEFESEWRIQTLRSLDLELWTYINVEDFLKKGFQLLKCSKSLRGSSGLERLLCNSGILW